MHLDEEQVQRLLDAELTSAEERVAREHLDACDECRQGLEIARDEERRVKALLSRLDVPPPRIEVAAIEARGAAGARSRELLLKVAGFVVALAIVAGGYAAYATPGSPLRGWVVAVVQWIAGHPRSGPATANLPPGSEPHAAGIAVDPGQDLRVVFAPGEAEGFASVALTDGAEVAVHAPAGA